jgi:purine-nucleoside phosphorylase
MLVPNTTPGAHGTDPFEQARIAARELGRRTEADRHDAVVILGTGLSGVAPLLGAAGAPVDLSSLPWFDRFNGPGHRAVAWSVPAGTHRVLVVAGRSHLYEGRTPAEVAHTVRTAIAAGCGTVLLTCAAGALSADLTTGQVVLVSDHLNLTGASPLSGIPIGGAARTPFVDLTDAWSPRLRDLARSVDPGLVEGVYAQVAGPQLETPAEIRALAQIGAQLVGMSLAIEVIAARHLGAEVMGLAVVTNPGAGMAVHSLTDESITSVAEGAAPEVAKILGGVIGKLGERA